MQKDEEEKEAIVRLSESEYKTGFLPFNCFALPTSYESEKIELLWP